MSKINHIFYNTSLIHDYMGKDLAELGGVLRCTVCGHEMSLTTENIAKYLRSGWPRHCEQGMRWFTSKELAAEPTESEGR